MKSCNKQGYGKSSLFIIVLLPHHFRSFSVITKWTFKNTCSTFIPINSSLDNLKLFSSIYHRCNSLSFFCLKNINIAYMWEKVNGSVAQSVASDFLQLHGLQPTRLLSPWDSPGKNTGMGSHSFLQGIFPTQRSNSCLLHCRQNLYYLSHQGNPLHTERESL